MDTKSSNENRESLVNEWYLFRNCSKFGPLTAKEIGELLDKNQISKDHHVWHQTYNNWIAIKDVEVFQSVGFELQNAKKDVTFIEGAAETKSVVNAVQGADKGPSIFKKVMRLFK